MLRRLVKRGGQPSFPGRTDTLEAESGQGLAEYAMILALIAVVCVAGLSALGVSIANSAGFTSLPMNL